ncbi:MAG: hypothetical protein IPM57_05355 [Oligoflexia bacterium]|nr:hypothetical protein [Oligoflexia bacterium]
MKSLVLLMFSMLLAGPLRADPRCPGLMEFLSRPIKAFSELRSYNKSLGEITETLRIQFHYLEMMKSPKVSQAVNDAIRYLNNQLNLNMTDIKGQSGNGTERSKKAEDLFANPDGTALKDLTVEQKDLLKKVIIRRNIEIKINEQLFRSTLHEIDTADKEVVIGQLSHEFLRLTLLNPRLTEDQVETHKQTLSTTQKKIIHLQNKKAHLLKRLDEIADEIAVIKFALRRWEGISTDLDFYIHAGNQLTTFYSENGRLLSDDPSLMVFKQNILNAKALRSAIRPGN